MSVATRNPFAILGEDDARPSSPPPPSQSAPPQDQQPPPSKQRRGGPASRGGKYYPRGGSRPNTDRDPQPSEESPAATDAKPRRFDGERRDGRGRGRGANRGRGRTFDRHSGTGKTDSDKKIHNGWGGDDGNAELKVEEAATFDAAAESAGGLNSWAAPVDTPAADDWGTPTQEPAPEHTPTESEKPETARRRDRDADEEDNTLTLDQYLAQQKEKESSLLPKLETRKANEGAQDPSWGGATRLEKGEGQAYFSGKTKSGPRTRTEKKEKVFLEIDAHFDRPLRGRGRGESRGRGGRGRGGRDRGAFNGASNAVNVDDQTAFPSLS